MGANEWDDWQEESLMEYNTIVTKEPSFSRDNGLHCTHFTNEQTNESSKQFNKSLCKYYRIC